MTPPTTRLAPSPTGALHLGNARTFVLTWVHVRAAGGRVLFRMDDLDGPRVKAGADRQAREDLHWLGLDWDGEEVRQSERSGAHAAAIERLSDAGRTYPCVCSRREIEEAASAPHGEHGVRYPGTCDGRFASRAEATAAAGKAAAVRFRAPPGGVSFDDLLFGPRSFEPERETGDFPILRGSGEAAYQLATVVDDAAAGVDLVIRGADLLPSTARQILLLEALGLARPAYLHLPLVVGEDGRRLAKRHGDTRIATLRAIGLGPDEIVGWVARTAGLAGPGERLGAADLVARYDFAALATDEIVVRADTFVRGGAQGV